jgi:ribosomal protein L11 methyltransferase
MLHVFPAGFEESEIDDLVELAGYAAPSEVEAICAQIDAAHVTSVAPGWATAWQEFHEPVMIGDLWLGPPWIDPPAGATAVVIRPGMAFGTGAHATTRLCIELLSEEPRGMLVDLGCGSGVLSIAACVLGFDPVLAVDIDCIAVAEAREHALLNQVTLDARQGDAADLGITRPALVVANLPAEALQRSLAALEPVSAIVSGFPAGESISQAGYRVSELRESDGWGAARLQRLHSVDSGGV